MIMTDHCDGGVNNDDDDRTDEDGEDDNYDDDGDYDDDDDHEDHDDVNYFFHFNLGIFLIHCKYDDRNCNNKL